MRSRRPVQRKSTNLSLMPGWSPRPRLSTSTSLAPPRRAIEAAVKQERERLWRIQNRGAIEAWNSYVEESGVPLEENRH